LRRLTGGRELLELSRDAGTVVITPKMGFVAETEADVVAAVVEAGGLGLSVTPRGGGTAIPTQSVGRGAVLMQARTGAVIREGYVTCEPGIVKAELNRRLNVEGVWMPVDPSSYASATVGGMVANNSSGARTMKYGSTIDYVAGLRVVHPWGEARPISPVPLDEALSSDERVRKTASLLLENQDVIMDEAPKVTKNSSGYRLERGLHDGALDLPRLFVGSEGTLGVITEVELRTLVRPRWRVLLVIEAEMDELGRATDPLRALAPSALELVDKSIFRKTGSWDRVARYSRSESSYLIFCELDGTEGDEAAGLEKAAKISGLDPLVISSPSEIQAAWDARNETLTLAQEMRRGEKIPVPGLEDLTVPPPMLKDLVKLLVDTFESKGLEYIMYGHAGDANLHARPLMDPADRRAMDLLMEECFEVVWKMKGTMTGEHGDGALRARFVERQYPRTYWIMKELKKIYDPKGVMNPGVKVVF
jgi:glycolate oxidase